MVRKKRPVSKRSLEIQLGNLGTLEKPQLGLEQYTVSPEAASELLFMAGFEHNDLDGQVIDLGTGTGRLAIGAALMGAEQIVGLDIDRKSVDLATQNGLKTRVDVDWVVSSLNAITGDFNTVLMNPPYGTRHPHQDIRFLSKAFELARVSYSIHKSSTRKFLTQYVVENGRKIDEVRSMTMRIPHMYEFHNKKWKGLAVDLYRISR